MNPTLMTALAYTLAIPVALAQRLLPALQLSFEYLLFLMTNAGALPEMTTAPMPIASLALVEAVTAVATPVKPPSKSTRKTSTPKTSTATTATTTKRRGKKVSSTIAHLRDAPISLMTDDEGTEKIGL